MILTTMAAIGCVAFFKNLTKKEKILSGEIYFFDEQVKKGSTSFNVGVIRINKRYDGPMKYVWVCFEKKDDFIKLFSKKVEITGCYEKIDDKKYFVIKELILNQNP